MFGGLRGHPIIFLSSNNFEKPIYRASTAFEKLRYESHDGESPQQAIGIGGENLKLVQNVQEACPESHRRVQSLCSVQAVIRPRRFKNHYSIAQGRCRPQDTFKSFKQFNRFAPFKTFEEEKNLIRNLRSWALFALAFRGEETFWSVRAQL